MAKKKDVKLINLTKEKSEQIEVTIKNESYNLLIPYIFGDLDLLVNVPKIKYMNGTKISCALKNIFGCNAYPRKSTYHKILNEFIVALNKHIKSDLVIVDGIIVNGYALKTRRLGLVMTSRDPVAIDAAASKIAGLNPKSVNTIKFASMEGLGNPRYTAIGEDIDYFKELFPNKRIKDDVIRFINSAYSRFFSSH